MNTPENLVLLQAAAQGLRESWDAVAALRINLGIHEDDDNKGDALECAIEAMAGTMNESTDLADDDLQTIIDTVHGIEAEHG